VALGYFWRRQDPLKQAGVMAMTFALHAVYFVDRASAWEETAVLSAFAIGTGLVFAVNALVEIRLHRLQGLT
jgi:glutamine synthetase adenylyltransferase